MVDRRYFKCDTCDVALYLLPPVERPCPCGGQLEEVSMGIEINGSKNKALSSVVIDQMVAKSFPEVLEGLEELLEAHSEKKGD